MLFRVFLVILINIMPMVVLDFSWWIIVVVAAALAVSVWASIPYFGIWIWAAVVIVQRPFTWFTVVFFVCMLLALASDIAVIKTARKNY